MDPTLQQDEAGNYWLVDANGNVVSRADRNGNPIQSQGRIIPNAPDPAAQYEGPQAAAQARSAGAEAYVDEATRDARIRRENAEAEAQELENTVTRREIEEGPQAAPISGAQRSEGIQGFTSSMALNDIIAGLEQRYEEGPGGTGGLRGVLDYFPREANQRFDRAANAARGTVGDVLGFTGGQLNSAAEAQMNIGPFIPQASDRDATIEDTIGRLRDLQRQGIERSVAILGGVPDANGNVIPVPQGAELTPENVQRIISGEQPASVFDQSFMRAPAANRAAGSGAETEAIPFPDGFQEGHAALVNRLVQEGGGRIDPQAYARERAALDEQFGIPASNADAYSGWASRVNDYLDEGGQTIPTGVMPLERELSGLDQFRNNLVSNPLGAGTASFANSLTLGAPEAFAGDQFDVLREAQPTATLAGDVGGAIVGTGGIGALGRFAAGRVAPRLLGGGSRAQFGRNLATDATYAGGYSSMTGGDVGTDTALGAGGSAAGQLLARGAGAALRGADVSPDARYLQERGVPLTTGQLLGGTARNFEQRAGSMPFIGDLIGRRYEEGFQGFNRAAFEDAGAPIGFRPQNIGQDGIQELRAARSNAYDEATSGFEGQIDDQFVDDFVGVVETAQRRLPRDQRRRFGRVLEARVNPLTENPTFSGYDYQQARRGLVGARNGATGPFPGFEDVYRDSLSGTEDALSSLVERQGGESVISGLRNANTANRNIETLDNAISRNAGGSNTGENFVTTPSQLQRAGMQTQRRFPGERPFQQLADAGQEVMPRTIPNSGTADRLMQSGMLSNGGILTAGVGGGAGLGYALGGQEGAETGAAAGTIPTAAMILAALGGTRRGQRAINAALTAPRPEAVRVVGQNLRRRSGLFGSGAMAPLVVGQ